MVPRRARRDPVRPLALALAALLVTGGVVAAGRAPDRPAVSAGPAPATSAPPRAAKPAATRPPAPPPPLRPVRCAPERPRRGVPVRGRVVDAWNRPLACSRVVIQPKLGFGDYFGGVVAALTLGFACRTPGVCDLPGATLARTDRAGRFTAYLPGDRVDHTLTVVTPAGDAAAQLLKVPDGRAVDVPTIRVWSFAPRAVRKGNDVTVRFTPPPASWEAGEAEAYVVRDGHEIQIPWVVTNTLVRLPDADGEATFDARRVEDGPATLYVQAPAGGAMQLGRVRVPAGPRAVSRGARCTRTRGRCALTDGVLTDPPTGTPAATLGDAPGIDLGAVRRVRYVVVHGCVPYREVGSPGGHTDIEASADGRSWRPLYLLTEGVGLYVADCFGPVDVSARYVRVRGSVRGVREIAVF